jgi:diguanylate cyclase (GGDEF)-like protein
MRIASSPRCGGYFAAMAVVLALALIGTLVFATQVDGLQTAPAKQLSAGWSYLQNGEPRPLGTLPTRFGTPEDSVTLRHALTADIYDSDDVFAFRAYYANIRVWADDRLIYESPAGESRVPTIIWHFIPMADCSGAQTLTVELTRHFGSNPFQLDAPYLDGASAIQHTLIAQNGLVITFTSLCILLTIGLLVCAGVLYRWRSGAHLQLLALATFVALSGLWVLLDAKILNIFGGNLALAYFLNYAAFLLLPVPFLLYIRFVASEGQRILTALIWVALANAVLSMLICLSGIATIGATLFSIHALIILSMLAAIWTFLRNKAWRRGSDLRFTFFGMLLISACVLVSLVFFYLRGFNTSSASALYPLGLSLLFIFMAVDALAVFGRFWRQKDIAERYRRLAMEDSMTGMNNRNAFQLHWSAMLEQPPEALAIIVFDVDNLKQINDQCGHQAGDSAISTCAQQIRLVFEGAGSCYRTGGDEFEVLIEGRQIDRIPALLDRFSKALNTRWDHSLPSDGVSYGWAAASFGDDNPLTEVALVRLRAEADQSLYRLKQARKGPEEESIN